MEDGAVWDADCDGLEGGLGQRLVEVEEDEEADARS
jgi:hypothetical protein